MKVLLVGPFRSGTGYGYSAINYALALKSVNIDVICRSVDVNNQRIEVSEEVEELLAKSSRGCDAVIQHLTPNFYEYDAACGLNIGLFCTEFDSLNYSDWPSYINLMDEAWVFNRQSRQAVLDSHVTVPVNVVHQPCDVDKYFRGYAPYLPEGPNFRFYTIGEYIKRKNFAALLKAFYLEFSPEEPMELVIKTSPGSLDKVQHDFNLIREGMMLYPSPDLYRSTVVIAEHLTDEELCGLHVSCNCYVSPSFGESWSLPCYDAMGFGNTPVVSDFAGHQEYIDYSTGWLVHGRMEPVFGMQGASPPGYGSARHNWFSVDINDLAHKMRLAYKHRQNKNLDFRSHQGTRRVEEFSYAAMGRHMKELLTEALKRKGERSEL